MAGLFVPLIFSSLLASVTCDDILLTAMFNISFTTSRCSALPPPVKLYIRYRTPQQAIFSPWYLAYYYLGNCDDYQKVSLQIPDLTQVQYRLELFPTATEIGCSCVTISDSVYFTTPVVTTLDVSDLFCNGQVTTNSLCTTNRTRTFLSQVLNVTTDHIYPVGYCSSSADDEATAVQMLTGVTVCPQDKAHCLPLQSVQQKNIFIELTFSLVLNYRSPPAGICWPLDSANEGIFVYALIGHQPNVSILPLHFYNTQELIWNNSQALRIDMINSSYYMLNYTTSSFTGTYIVPFTTTNTTGPVSYTVNITDSRVMTENVAFAWTQYYATREDNCDNWALDNVTVVLHINGISSQQIYSEYFNDNTNWTLNSATYSMDTTECDNDDNCLFFTSGLEREAISPYLNLSVLSQPKKTPAVSLALAPLQQTSDEISCDDGNQIVHISFLLQLRQFIQPAIPSNPTAILLSLYAEQDTPLAYYAPAGNKYWTDFNTTTLYGVPIYSPSATQKTVVSVCVRDDTRELSLIWRQDNYTADADIWSLSQVNISSQYFLFNNESWDYVNGNISQSECTGDEEVLIFDRGNGSTSRVATFNFSIFHTSSSAQTISSISPVSISSPAPISSPVPVVKCPSDNEWPATLASHTANGTCYEGTVNATRYCRSDGIWNNSVCHVSRSFEEVIAEAKENPEGALNLIVTDQQQQNELISEQSLLLLDLIIQSALLNESVQISQDFSQLVLDTVDSTLDTAERELLSANLEVRRRVGGQLLLTLDEFALSLANQKISSPTIKLRVQTVESIGNESIEGISSDGNSISLPTEIFNPLPVKIASFIYRNLLPVLVPHDQSRTLLSSVISAAIDCEECIITNLTVPVLISFNITSQQAITSDRLFCVYWEFNFSNGNTSLATGRWDSSGCVMSNQNGSIVTCQCNHLTHFAILLSPEPFGPLQPRSILTIVGQVFIPISLICMLLTVLAYSCMRKLWSMRNYIHIMLCSNLFIAQLLFLIGIKRTENEYVCSAIAVVLQYMFLVTFMWMLMEGVILYIALVKVFVKQTRRYTIGFTLFSYGVPVVYMMIVVPIGFLVDTNNNSTSHYLSYNNEELVACWLSYESGFVWAFIAPVVIVILINICFLVMAIVIIRRRKNQAYSVKQWLKATVSLTILMGIGWLSGVFYFRKELLFIAYIQSVFIAVQGIVIFILLVLLDKSVRVVYLKWWTTQWNNLQLTLPSFKKKKNRSVISDNGNINVNENTVFAVQGVYSMSTLNKK